jgi:hypothetical protein
MSRDETGNRIKKRRLRVLGQVFGHDGAACFMQ